MFRIALFLHLGLNNVDHSDGFYRASPCHDGDGVKAAIIIDLGTVRRSTSDATVAKTNEPHSAVGLSHFVKIVRVIEVDSLKFSVHSFGF